MKQVNKLIVVSPFEWNDRLYVHLYEFIQNLRKFKDIDYIHFQERGLLIEKIEKKWRKNIFNSNGYYAIKKILNDIKKLRKHKKNIRRQDYKVIAIDNFIYLVCCFIFGSGKVILWSHDFISLDNPSQKYLSQKIIKKGVRHFIDKSDFAIIQTVERRNAFLESIAETKAINFFFLPVCMNINRRFIPKETFSNKIRLLQIGGINEVRSNSVTLLNNYNSRQYSLIFHGFITTEFKDAFELIDESDRPIVSDRVLKPEDLANMVYNSCDIGLISYKSYDDNFKKIACSSGQFAEFVRAYKPLISYGDNTLTDFINENNLGIGIKNVTDLDVAVDKISAGYSYYVNNVSAFCHSNFDLEKYVDNLSKII